MSGFTTSGALVLLAQDSSPSTRLRKPMLDYLIAPGAAPRSGRKRLSNSLHALEQARFTGVSQLRRDLADKYHSADWTDEYAGKVAAALDRFRVSTRARTRVPGHYMVGFSGIVFQGAASPDIAS